MRLPFSAPRGWVDPGSLPRRTLPERELAVPPSWQTAEPSAIVLDDSLPHGASAPGLDIIPETEFAAAIESGPLADYAPCAASNPAFLIYTSGTTASPKGVLHAHRSAWGRLPCIRAGTA